MDNECKCYNDGMCLLHRCRECKRYSINDFDYQLKECDMEDVCKEVSSYDNYLFEITDEQIDALKSGKVLYFEDEYGYFIAYKGKSEV